MAPAGLAEGGLVEARTGSVTSGPARFAVEAMLAKVKRLPRVVGSAVPHRSRFSCR
jgi:hypothetical protein